MYERFAVCSRVCAVTILLYLGVIQYDMIYDTVLGGWNIQTWLGGLWTNQSNFVCGPVAVVWDDHAPR